MHSMLHESWGSARRGCVGGNAKNEEEKNTMTENGFKQRLLIQMRVGGMMFCMSGCVAVSCHQTHTNAPQCGLVCVSPTFLTVKQQGLERIKPINRKKLKCSLFLKAPAFFLFFFKCFGLLVCLPGPCCFYCEPPNL